MPSKAPTPKTAPKTTGKAKAKPDTKKRGAPAKPFLPGNPGGPGRPKGITKQGFYAGLRTFLEDTADGKSKLNRFIELFFEKALTETGWQSQMLAERLLERDFLDKITTQLDAGRREDEDFLAYRCIKDLFGESLRSALSRSRITCDMAGRRAGKTQKNIRKAAKAMSRPGSPVLILGLTFQATIAQYWDGIVGKLEQLGLDRELENRSEGYIKLANGSECYFRGNSTRDEREKLRGYRWALAVVDEAQSQKALASVIEEILEPATIDLKGQIAMSGTGPRVRGTYFEHVWTNRPDVDRFNWNLTSNPFIPDGEAELERILATKGLTKDSPLYIREYLGQIAYDDDALVFRLGPGNLYESAALDKWIAEQIPTDLRLTGGLDFGFEDADALAIILHAERRPERWLIAEYKARRTGTQELADAIKATMARVKAMPSLAKATEAWRQFLIYADTGGLGKKNAYDLSTQYGLPVSTAYKHDKNMGIEMLQDDVRRGAFRVQAGSVFAEEALKTVFKRNEKDELTREVDDDTYHPDLIDAVLYAMRQVQLFARKE